ncbi:dihydroneopterin aldolase [Methyloligella sp. 2.7D]|uniref:dihydroneopterin aldolase n=1 Tax=unclassified Methyloligella TaxID=2625955 RepID=UPI00157BD83F|nr:dihydroneopterin aldolase [Methyloligella sp. GL2]QKP77785.1 dihydroneopterin aldolase [Methyloligella sp. GL2]
MNDVADKTMPRKGKQENAGGSAGVEAPRRDVIFVRDYVLDCEIGVYTNEKGVTQRVRISVDVEIDATDEALNDDIAHTFDYDVIINGVRDVALNGHINLTETIAEEIAAHCLAHPRAHLVKVKVEKLDKAPGSVGVEIVRQRVGS